MASIDNDMKKLESEKDVVKRRNFVQMTAIFFVTLTGARPIEGSWVVANPESVQHRPNKATGYW